MQIRHSQKGLALLMLVFVLALVAIAYAVNALDSSGMQNEKNKRTSAALAEAKAALIGWSVSHPIHPGVLPFPDRSTDGNYDGNSDCSATSPSFGLLIGRLPFLGQTTPCAAPANGLATNITDGNGEQLWYAVSRNLIRTSVVPIINPSIIDAPTEGWLVVRDKNGQILSNRVAAVIIAPGLPVSTQNRAGGLAGALAYLDSLTVAGTEYSNANYTIANEDFILGEDMQNVLSTDPMYLHPYQFNDRLVYITIDELITALEKRVIQEVASNLNSYYEASAAISSDRFYPYAADISFNCIDGLLRGALPIGAACSTPALTSLPTWFGQNEWENFIYYAMSPECSDNGPNRGCSTGAINVGVQANVNAILIATGGALSQTELVPIFPQSRPSNDVRDYLDSVENSNGDSAYDAKNKPKSNIYNDQIFILTP